MPYLVLNVRSLVSNVNCSRDIDQRAASEEFETTVSFTFNQLVHSTTNGRNVALVNRQDL